MINKDSYDEILNTNILAIVITIMSLNKSIIILFFKITINVMMILITVIIIDMTQRDGPWTMIIFTIEREGERIAEGRENE